MDLCNPVALKYVYFKVAVDYAGAVVDSAAQIGFEWWRTSSGEACGWLTFDH